MKTLIDCTYSLWTHTWIDGWMELTLQNNIDNKKSIFISSHIEFFTQYNVIKHFCEYFLLVYISN